MFKKSSDKRLQRGQGMTEYIIIVGVIAIAAIGAFGYFGSVVESQISGMGAELAGEDGTGAQQAAAGFATKGLEKTNTANDLKTYTEGNDQN